MIKERSTKSPISWLPACNLSALTEKPWPTQTRPLSNFLHFAALKIGLRINPSFMRYS
jgi:hypothetical protein